MAEGAGRGHKPWVPDVFWDFLTLIDRGLGLPLPCAPLRVRVARWRAGGWLRAARALTEKRRHLGAELRHRRERDANVTPGWSPALRAQSCRVVVVVVVENRGWGHRNPEALALVESERMGWGGEPMKLFTREKNPRAGWDGV